MGRRAGPERTPPLRQVHLDLVVSRCHPGAVDDSGTINDARADSRRRPSQLPQMKRRPLSIGGVVSDARWRSSVIADLQDNLAGDRVMLFRREGIASIGQWQHLTNNRSQLSRINSA